MKALHDLDLMQRADGELDPAAAAEVDAVISNDDVAGAKVAALGELGQLVRGHLELGTDAVPDARFEAIWREVDKGIDREASAAAAIGVGAAVNTAAVGASSKQHGEPSGGLWSRLARWFDRYRSHIITGALSAGAVAGLALALQPASSGQADDRNGSPSGPIQVRPVGQRAPAIIESLDVPNGTGNVINVHDEEGNTTVIWVTPADTVEGT
jgi:hypothetical protein